jgi:hypothetical protein
VIQLTNASLLPVATPVGLVKLRGARDGERSRLFLMNQSNEELRQSLKEIGQEIMKLLDKAGGMARETAGDVSRWAGKAVGGDDDALNQIERLGQLREKGFVTEEEFQAKKTELLKKIG